MNSKHGVLIYGNGITLPFVPKYLSMCLENSISFLYCIGLGVDNLYFPLMYCHLGGMGKLSDQLADHFRQFVGDCEK